MAVHIRHGAPGSFKTACAVWFDILTWLRDGRSVYTNIRDMKTVSEIESVIGEDFPDTAEIICIDTDSQSDRLKFACWFHWLPIGAAICIDEGQFIYPSRTDFKPVTLDFPGGLDAATKANRPPDIFTALDKHRHYNWDIVVTTPNIKKIPNWFRDVVETAYHHKNMEHIPFYGKRKTREHRHDPSTTGTTINKQSQYLLRKVPVEVHSLYGSTITGTISKNRAETNPLKNPRLIGFLVLSVLSIITSSYLIFGTGDVVQDDIETGDSVHVDEDIAKVNSNAVLRVAPEKPTFVNALADTTGIKDFFPGATRIYVSGHYYSGDIRIHTINIDTDNGSYSILDDDLLSYGFEVETVNPCNHVVYHELYQSRFKLYCARSTPESAILARQEESRHNLTDPSSHLPL